MLERPWQVGVIRVQPTKDVSRRPRKPRINRRALPAVLGANPIRQMVLVFADDIGATICAPAV